MPVEIGGRDVDVLENLPRTLAKYKRRSGSGANPGGGNFSGM